MDSITEEVYRVSCGALVSVLLSQKQGSLRLQNYLLDVDSKHKESMEKLKAVFPEKWVVTPWWMSAQPFKEDSRICRGSS